MIVCERGPLEVLFIAGLALADNWHQSIVAIALYRSIVALVAHVSRPIPIAINPSNA